MTLSRRLVNIVTMERVATERSTIDETADITILKKLREKALLARARARKARGKAPGGVKVMEAVLEKQVLQIRLVSL
jgi:hypothetical protein